ETVRIRPAMRLRVAHLLEQRGIAAVDQSGNGAHGGGELGPQESGMAGKQERGEGRKGARGKRNRALAGGRDKTLIASGIWSTIWRSELRFPPTAWWFPLSRLLAFLLSVRFMGRLA